MQSSHHARAASCIAMMKGQLATNGIHEQSVLEAISAIDRSQFVPELYAGSAYVDDAIRLCAHRYLPEPLLFARLLAHAQIEVTDRVLDVGAGLGYSCAVLSHLAHHVTGVEENAELVSTARKKLALAEIDNVDLVTAPFGSGCSAYQPYDRILIEGAVADLPHALEEQLSEGGRIVAIRAHQPPFATGKLLGTITIGTKGAHGVSYVEKECVNAYPLHRPTSQQPFSL